MDCGNIFDHDHVTHVNKKEFDLAVLLAEGLIESIARKEKFRIVIEKKPDADKISVEYRF